MIAYSDATGLNALTFARPPPAPFRPLHALLLPLTWRVWACVAAALVAAAAASYFVAEAEAAVMPRVRPLDDYWAAFSHSR